MYVKLSTTFYRIKTALKNILKKGGNLFYNQLDKNNGMLRDRSRVGGKAHNGRGKVLKTFMLNMFLSKGWLSQLWLGGLLSRACAGGP